MISHGNIWAMIFAQAIIKEADDKLLNVSDLPVRAQP